MMKRYTIVIHGCLNCFPLLSFLFFRVCLVAIVLLFSCCVSFGIDQVVDRVLRTPTGQKWHSFARTAHFKATPYLAYFFNVTFEHYMDVVLTTVETDDFAIDVYEYTVHSHHYQSSDRPHARYDLCPVTETLFFFFPCQSTHPSSTARAQVLILVQVFIRPIPNASRGQRAPKAIFAFRDQFVCDYWGGVHRRRPH